MGLEGGCGTWRKKNIKVVKIFTIYVQTLSSRGEVISVQNGLVSCKIYKKWAKHTQRRITHTHTYRVGSHTHSAGVNHGSFNSITGCSTFHPLILDSSGVGISPNSEVASC